MKIYFAFPSFAPVGGVVKLMNYVQHAQRSGFDAVIVAKDAFDPLLPLFRLRGFTAFSSWGVPIEPPQTFRLCSEDFFFFSWPLDFQLVERFLPCLSTNHVIHIVQGVRHADPTFLDGYALRLLSRPMTRIAISDIVYRAIAPHVNPSSTTRTIPLAHQTEFFERRRQADQWHDPIRVAYALWKSSAGAELEKALSSDGRFVFRRIQGRIDWESLRAVYHWADVFLCFPRRQEGFYLPGIEAMSAQCIVVAPDVVGNRDYCRFGSNCIQVEWDDVGSYKAALSKIATMPVAERTRMRLAGAASAQGRQLVGEQQAFARLIADLERRGSKCQA